MIIGFLLDILLKRDHNKDIDILAVCSEIEFALKISELIPFHPKVQVFKNYGKADITTKNTMNTHSFLIPMKK